MFKIRMNKTKIVMLSVISSAAIFIGIVALEKTLVKYTPKVKVLYCTKDINRKEPLEPSKFELKEVEITSINMDIVKSLDTIKGMYAAENIYANEPLNKKRIGTEKEINSYKLNPGEREFCLKFDNLEDVLGGTLRKDDIVDIMFTSAPTQKEPTTKTITLVQCAAVLDALDANGRILDEKDKSIPASQILFGLDPKIGHQIENLRGKGKIKLMKAPKGDKKYNPITVVDGNIVEEK